MIEWSHNKDDSVLNKILRGDDLNIFLQPDSSIKNRKGEDSYIESLDLPHIIGNGQYFWACQRNAVVLPAKDGLRKGFYAYYSGYDIFAWVSYFSDNSALRREPQNSMIMSSGRYETLEWGTKQRYEQVFSSKNPEDTKDYIDAIKRSSSFKAILFFGEGVFQVHPIVYPFYYPHGNRVDFQTELQFFPDYMRYPQQAFVEGALAKQRGFLENYKDPKTREYSFVGNNPFFCSYFQVYKDGKCKRAYDLNNNNSSSIDLVEIYAST